MNRKTSVTQISIKVGFIFLLGLTSVNAESVKPLDLIVHMKIQLENGISEKTKDGFRRIVARLDLDGDGKLSLKEYAKNKHFRNNPAGTRGFFAGADTNRDGFMSLNEYAWQRIITDEAKKIYFLMDTDGNRRVSREEFIKNLIVQDRDVSKRIFSRLDTNGNNELVLPEYLRVWSRWARAGRTFGSLY